MPDSVVIELQRLASDGNAVVSDLLRKALLVSTKLKLEDFKTWVEAELSGYKGRGIAIPKYRSVEAELKAYNPYRGMIPVQMEDNRTAEYYGRMNVANALPELEAMIRMERGQILQKLPPEHSATGIYGGGTAFDTYRVLSRSQIIGIVEAVRTMILQWALKLEAEGIVGDGMSFSNSDKQRAAAAASIHIANFQGVLGDVTTENLQIGNYASIHNQLKEVGISQEERNELENILDELKKADKPETRRTLTQRGMDWLGRNAENLGALAAVIRGWFQ